MSEKGPLAMGGGQAGSGGQEWRAVARSAGSGAARPGSGEGEAPAEPTPGRGRTPCPDPGRARLRPSRDGRGGAAPAEPRQAGRRGAGRLGGSLALPPLSALERARSDAGASLEKNFWRFLPAEPSVPQIVPSPVAAVSPAATVTCRGTSTYRGGEEGSSAGLGGPGFSYEPGSEATKDPVC